MKLKKQPIYTAAAIAMLTITFSCKKDFLEKPSKNEPTLETYYDNSAQVRGATGLLYNSIWYEYQDKAFHAIGEVLSGNMYTGDPKYNTFMNFSISGTDEQVTRSWYAFYKEAGNATVLINTFEQKKAQVSNPAFLVQGIAEARFMRAVAYFYLARVFGAVPIITDPVKLAETGNFNVPRYIQSDVLKFAIEDLTFAEQNLQTTDEPGRVTQNSAKGMMAKIYLYLKDYPNAKLKASEVMASGKYSLYPDYNKMFTDPSANNNQEVLFAFQWLAAGGYSIGNPIQAYVGPSTLLLPTTGAGYSAIIPSIDLLNSYEFDDKRRGWSVMEQGFSRPDWKNVNFPNGFKYDTTYVTSSDEKTKIKTGTRSNALKYVVGPGGNGVNVNGSSTDINTYILRYADILLIYAEATLGTSGSTSDATALKAFNDVRRRAGFGASADKTALTPDIILHERRVEFAFEGDYWFDIQRQGFAKAKQIIDNQERGTYGFAGKHTIDSIKATLRSADNLFIPIPTTEILTNPELAKPAIPYYN
jgi:hypothetical protein